MNEPSNLEILESYISIVESLATIVAVVIAYLAGRFAWQQHADQVRQEAESRAKSLLARSIELNIEYPRFAEPGPLSAFKKHEIIAYKWFVGFQLNMCEELIKYSSDEHWVHEVSFIIELHKEWIGSEEFQTIDINSYQDPLRTLLLRPA